MVLLLEVFWWVFLGGQEINNFVFAVLFGLVAVVAAASDEEKGTPT